MKNHFSYYAENYKNAVDKENHIKEMFVTLLAEQPKDSVLIEPQVITIGDEMLKLFYKYLWFKNKNPEIDNFGQRFFNEIGDADYQIHILRSFMNMLWSSYRELYNSH